MANGVITGYSSRVKSRKSPYEPRFRAFSSGIGLLPVLQRALLCPVDGDGRVSGLLGDRSLENALRSRLPPRGLGARTHPYGGEAHGEGSRNETLSCFMAFFIDVQAFSRVCPSILVDFEVENANRRKELDDLITDTQVGLLEIAASCLRPSRWSLTRRRSSSVSCMTTGRSRSDLFCGLFNDILMCFSLFSKVF